MSAGEPAPSSAVALESADLRIDCYVRSGVSAPIAEIVDGVVGRLESLCEAGRIDEYRVSGWPPETGAASAPSRGELVAAFERWADRNGCSIEPGFRRRERPTSPLGTESAAARERVRVPVVALALSADGDVTDPAALRGVVPYTERPNTADERTYTVDEWLSAVESDAADRDAPAAGPDPSPIPGGQR
ncbi:hypothetical protein HT576_10850 [Haloterrigena sp. SYSU A121-1]|uniref:Uncharacterized protein n=1 Tax=Haloterrigena gelatinilytica TaxID=2741724 RepID=A0A8J8KFZ3_9EURY|nr:HTH domain-containing protein [Haloterrigena gelatinilytica]NUB91512.1 hypothetical protein [Haloterrigena gelatinilytica]